jgi:hypothetical protein
VVWRKPAVDLQDFGEFVLFLHLLYPPKVRLVAALDATPRIVLDANVIRGGELPSLIPVGHECARNTRRNHAGGSARTGCAFAWTVIAFAIVVVGVALVTVSMHSIAAAAFQEFRHFCFSCFSLEDLAGALVGAASSSPQSPSADSHHASRLPIRSPYRFSRRLAGPT